MVSGVAPAGRTTSSAPVPARNRRRVVPGKKVAIIGAGGIGFDVAEFLVEHGESPALDARRWMAEWGVDPSFESPGGLAPPRPEPVAAPESRMEDGAPAQAPRRSWWGRLWHRDGSDTRDQDDE